MKPPCGEVYQVPMVILARGNTRSIRLAVNSSSSDAKLQNAVEADEAFIAGKPRASQRTPGRKGPKPGDPKAPVVAVVERGGQVRAHAMPNVTATNLGEFFKTNVDTRAALTADENRLHKKIGRDYSRHAVINHTAKKYVNGGVTKNTVEGFFRLIKRDVFSNSQHVSPEHFPHYVAEFEVRYNRRKGLDDQRRNDIIAAGEGKRRIYR